jgi:DNA mismatch repair protein PMS2
MAETILHEQKLIAPLPLELSPMEETTVLANLKVFEANGFRLHFDDTKPTRQRLSLTAVPHSGARDGRKAVQFGKDDVSALCQILASDEDAPSMESGGTGIDGSGMYGNNAVRRYATGNWNAESTDRIIARLPKAIAMLASRACRSSIMIGTGLSEREMDRIVKRLSEVAQPWNCPHGRPTMRHVGDLHPFLLDDERRAAAHVAGPTITIMSQDDE